ncbi:Glutamate synthase [NADPH] small chain [Pleomorphomonas sp. T1.2MG-36]|uniref:NAD(P)-dependent oxidoreductase n=1 Tax=Pleomorphomonas sp. T1.2MG-36 TaxID=3041167 RepID=UPI00247785F8|nr:NAD(P)-dependent oxidoreductase [Pleomorphomonas sp. T1.2MG-36]CAI9406941.1 Glutamate synthase [NADPH] small chain [Pleomorphomonas sp. T1.2MG-36]
MPDISAGRLAAADYGKNFSDVHPPLSAHEAVVESDRCYFCFDAPCTNACPTSIDIPLFIRKIGTGNVEGAAETIFASNILGGMCARVCPTETLCEEACVRNVAEEKPVRIGLLQRHSTDHYLERHSAYGIRAPATGRKVAVVGGGPSGLACAHELALKGHDVTIFEARGKAGGLNEFGIAAYKATDDFAQREVDFVLGVGGIAVESGKALGRDFTLADLRSSYDAVFLGLGLQAVNALGVEGEESAGVVDAVRWIEDLRQSQDKSAIEVGARVVVIGGGMTAVDAAVQAKKLGADEVTIAYRRGPSEMGASRYEQELAQVNGVRILHWVAPRQVVSEGNAVAAVDFERTALDASGRLTGTGRSMRLAADQVMKAIGQTFVSGPVESGETVALDGGRIAVDGDMRTSLANVWAGGDCVRGGEDLTVQAVDHGKRAALSIHVSLSA